MAFRYARDPVCLVACTCYALNRWCVPAAMKGVFLRGHFADVLFVPAALPLMLWVQRKFGLRATDTAPAPMEVLMHLAIWSFAAEVLGPRLFARATGDPWDVVAYAAGSLIAALFWRSA